MSILHTFSVFVSMIENIIFSIGIEISLVRSVAGLLSVAEHIDFRWTKNWWLWRYILICVEIKLIIRDS